MKTMAETLGGRISELLNQYGLTQRELAAKVGVTEVSMSRYIKANAPRAARFSHTLLQRFTPLRNTC